MSPLWGKNLWLARSSFNFGERAQMWRIGWTDERYHMLKVSDFSNRLVCLSRKFAGESQSPQCYAVALFAVSDITGTPLANR